MKERLIRAKNIINRKSKLNYNKFVKINSHGFRDKERSHEKKKGVFRILVLGDSMTEALQIPLEQSYPYILETMLNSESGKRFEVVNLAVSGFNTAQEYLMFKYYGLKYQPDFVILSFFNGDDFRGNSFVLERELVNSDGGEINNGHNPYFILNGEKVGEKGFEIEVNSSSKEITKRDQNGLLYIIKRISVGLYPNIYYSLVDWVKESPRVADLFLKSGSTKIKSKRSVIPSSYEAYAEESSPRWQNDWKVTKFLISKLARELKKRGTDFLVIVIPNEFELKSDKWGKVLHKYPEMKTINFDIKKPERILVKFLKKDKIDYLLLRPKLEKYSRKTGNDLYLNYNESHWNSNGHAIVAQLIYRKLRDYKLTPRASYTSLKDKSCVEYPFYNLLGLISRCGET
ncbi:MAG TPA: hypothetical protein VHT73_02615 [Thermodesulfobacteriota bacterium]|nr:hypothetical protein [Thermodesulfobacteriota bacterium]